MEALALDFEGRLDSLQSLAEARSSELDKVVGITLEQARAGAASQTALRIDIGSRIGPIRDQRREGTTVGFGLAYALAAGVTRLKALTPVYSARSIYVEARKRDEWKGEDHKGSSVRGGLRALEEVGAYLEADWPYDRVAEPLPGTSPSQKISSFAVIAEGRTDLIIDALRDEKPVVAAVSVTDGFSKVGADGRIRISDDASSLGGHVICIVGFDGERDEFRFANSWGTEWGESGFGYPTRRDLESILKNAATLAV